MKIFKSLAVAAFGLLALQVNAQNETPAEFKKGTITMPDGTTVSGWVKENIRKKASVTFMAAEGGKKKNYDGSDIAAVEIDGTKFICIQGDFFKVHCEGDLSFLQKASDASGKVVYNGSEAALSGGTDGKPNDYFIYNNKDKQLTLVSRKNVDEVVASSFAGCAAAINQGKSINGDLSQLKTAVELYNNRTK